MFTRNIIVRDIKIAAALRPILRQAVTVYQIRGSTQNGNSYLTHMNGGLCPQLRVQRLLYHKWSITICWRVTC
ncbi:hypothetical protein BDV33DRAFT_167064 [Aspergillus novoparasiticus]|uniref:Uncharacterized protein n=1 Tax=Aspergillus novoparasiticus TaxID=986946 RepID=A0A5N6F0W2_9EURO|nr:hypothetical protein BDV33DRAFT_167064 [Aspergillus novoparasiticus]